MEYYYGADDTTPTTYYYVLNLQGDVIQLIGSSGSVVANYSYDAWGKVIAVTDANGNEITMATHVANMNPIRYRGYFYDTETGFYYCNSRYYDPGIRRFINADAYVSTGLSFYGYNMFVYCENNPINNSDSYGALPNRFKPLTQVDPGADRYRAPFGLGLSNNYSLMDAVTDVVNDTIESTVNSAREVKEEIVNVADAALGSVEMEIGLGVGIGDEIKLGNCGITGVAAFDIVACRINYSEIQFGSLFTLEASATTQGIRFGPKESEFFDFKTQTSTIESSITNPDDWCEVGVFEFSYSKYWLIGGHVSIRFDSNTFFKKLYD